MSSAYISEPELLVSLTWTDKDCETVFWELSPLHVNVNEYVLTSLRTIWGVDLDYLSERFLENILEHFLKEIAKWIEKGYIQKKNTKYTLTQKGKAYADGVTSDLFIV